MRSLLPYTRDTTLVVLHIGCTSTASAEDRERLASKFAARTFLAPTCIPVQRNTRSLLYGHVHNLLYLSQLAHDYPQYVEPSHILIASADMLWVSHGVESTVRRQRSSIDNWSQQASRLQRVSGLRLHNPQAVWVRQVNDTKTLLEPDEDFRAIIAASRPGGSSSDEAPRVTVIHQQHEGSFYPWPVARDFALLLCRQHSSRSGSDLGRFHAQHIQSAIPLANGSYAYLRVEEFLLPTYAARALQLEVPAVTHSSQLNSNTFLKWLQGPARSKQGLLSAWWPTPATTATDPEEGWRSALRFAESLREREALAIKTRPSAEPCDWREGHPMERFSLRWFAVPRTNETRHGISFLCLPKPAISLSRMWLHPGNPSGNRFIRFNPAVMKMLHGLYNRTTVHKCSLLEEWHWYEGASLPPHVTGK